VTKPSDFIEDGHLVHFRWDKDEIHISNVECPHGGATASCNRLRDFCVVARFLGVYGSELNIGAISIDGPVEIAWLPLPGESDLDREFGHIWVVPVKDPDFVAAKFMQKEEENE